MYFTLLHDLSKIHALSSESKQNFAIKILPCFRWFAFFFHLGCCCVFLCLGWPLQWLCFVLQSSIKKLAHLIRTKELFLIFFSGIAPVQLKRLMVFRYGILSRTSYCMLFLSIVNATSKFLGKFWSCFLLVRNLYSTVVIFNDSHLDELTWSHFQNQVDSDKDSHSGCQNISQCHHQQKQFACVRLKVLSHSSMPFLKHLISFKVKRPGEENVKCTIMFLLDYQVRGINQMSVVN